ncbi:MULTISPECIES: SDR family NAD(P)-dependent oxidoreductase [Paraburkholderia]|uniref:SDR family NAD(P)-dependent oxidoreductase n=1 Tax=Paraburkholderia madseniana TaxID=2599607 RepID=A0AAP5BHE2_9BURK|nr:MULTISPECIES: SDR family oxidoreductase [Paraburkholderia]MCX4149800.1 SDR family NAD(P)-dependent oxidoreductase [Paraburkholderia madseniana]MDN7152736.1 SDR family oxidoreductase [Paraburkholderia sp. WS6]MDQ6411618.1 SDR family oxidoreductase [Paraburkholderia madseniana]
MSNTLSGKVAVILGGTGGIGAAAARRLGQAGARVVVVGQHDLTKAQRVADDLPGEGHTAALASITASETLNALAGLVRDRYGRADILVNTAGFTQPVKHSDLNALTDELIDEILKVNWRGQFAAIRAFRELLDASGDGLVVNVSSISGTTGVGSSIAYCAAKAGLDVMAASLGRALAPRIRVLNVSPGVVDTSFVPGRGDDFNDKVAATTPLGRIGMPDDIAAAIEACATHLKFSTGVTIVVDGGRRLN